MYTLNTKCRKDFVEWLENIDEIDLQQFFFANNNDEVNFGSEDFKLVYGGLSTGEPVGCHMVEARVNGQTRDKQLKILLKSTKSMVKDPSRLAFALVEKSMHGFCPRGILKEALLKSPVDGESMVNKVHLSWGPSVKLVNGRPCFEAGAEGAEYIFERIPMAGHDLDGKKSLKKGKERKKR